MNINPIQRSKLMNVYKTQKNIEHKESDLAVNKSINKTDQVILSKQGQIYEEALSELKAIADIRMEKVEEIQTRIKNGSYQYDSKAIAKNIIKGSLYDRLI